MISNLSNKLVLAHENNYQKGRKGKKICKITPHHAVFVGTAERIAQMFQNPTRTASANYCIGTDGDIVCNVEEENRAYTSSNATNDNQAITIEVANSSIGGKYPVSDKSWNALVDLCVDICTRYDFKLEYTGDKNGSLTEHRMFKATACPGEFLHERMKKLAKEVNTKLSTPVEVNKKIEFNCYTVKVTVSCLNIRAGAGTNCNVTGKITDKGTYTIVEEANGEGATKWGRLKSGAGWIALDHTNAINRKTDEEVAKEVLNGVWGNGEARKQKLAEAGYDYANIQKIVNNLLK